MYRTIKRCKQIAKEKGVDKHIKVNGWGSLHKSKLIVNKPWWLCFATLQRSCSNHDLAYGLGGLEKDRGNANLQFYNNIQRELKSNWLIACMLWKNSVKERIIKIAEIYFKFANESGKSSFRYCNITEGETPQHKDKPSKWSIYYKQNNKWEMFIDKNGNPFVWYSEFEAYQSVKHLGFKETKAVKVED